MKNRIKDLNLLLIYLNGWEEDFKKEPGKKIIRSWKGYPFELLNEFEEQNLIIQIRTGKSVFLTDKGMEKVKQLLKEYLPEKGK